MWSESNPSYPCAITTLRCSADCAVAAAAPLGEHFLTWAATSFTRSSQKFTEETRTVGSQSLVRGPPERSPEELSGFHRHTCSVSFNAILDGNFMQTNHLLVSLSLKIIKLIVNSYFTLRHDHIILFISV